MRASGYLGDLGGLAGHRQLIVLDLRGTGQSAIPDDPASYRCDRQVDDVAALQAHLGLDRIDVLAHSAGASIALQYAARYPHRVSKLALITPSGRAVDLEPDSATRREVVNRRQDEPWFPAAVAAFDRIDAGGGDDDDWAAIAPFFYGRWDSAAQAHAAADEEQTNQRRGQRVRRRGRLRPGGHPCGPGRVRRPGAGAGRGRGPVPAPGRARRVREAVPGRAPCYPMWCWPLPLAR